MFLRSFMFGLYILSMPSWTFHASSRGISGMCWTPSVQEKVESNCSFQRGPVIFGGWTLVRGEKGLGGWTKPVFLTTTEHSQDLYERIINLGFECQSHLMNIIKHDLLENVPSLPIRASGPKACSLLSMSIAAPMQSFPKMEVTKTTEE